MTKNDKEQISQTTTLDSIGYTGKIQASVMLGDRIISSKTYYNKGTSKLFEFFATCLTGNWVDAKATRPCKIILFKKDPLETEEFNSSYWTDTYAISSEVFQDTAIPRKSTGDGYEAVYHFRVPFLILVGGTKIAKIGLYSKTISSKADDLLAYFFLATDDQIDVPVASGNLTIIIDWSLRISNQTEA